MPFAKLATSTGDRTDAQYTRGISNAQQSFQHSSTGKFKSFEPSTHLFFYASIFLRIYFRSDRVHCINQEHSDWWVEKKVGSNLVIKQNV
jgi:hypothetical protein